MTIEWGTPGRASVLVGGNWGSEGKGLAAAWLSTHIEAPWGIATTNAGAQAGHTTKTRAGRNFVCYHLPTTAAMLPKWQAYLNAGSIIDPQLLLREIISCGVHESMVLIHPNAAVITADDAMAERMSSSNVSIGSTQKGVGAALANKVMRTGLVAAKAWALEPFLSKIDLNSCLENNVPVIVEVPQGLELSINHGCEYPYTTSRDCRVGSGLNDAGIHPSFLGTVAMAVRTFPIRVGAIQDDDGRPLGTSGPFYPDQIELSWAVDFRGIEPERTTVTKRVRRIATWSPTQYEHACRMNRPNIVLVMFCDYLKSANDLDDLVDKMKNIEADVGLPPVHRVYSFGPHVEDVTDDVHRARQWYGVKRA